MRGCLTLLLGFALAACGGNGDDGSDTTANRAQVRVAQAVLDAPALDVYVTANARLAAFPQLPSGSASGYVGLDQNSSYQFIVRAPGTSEIIAQLDLTLGVSQRLLLVISGALTPQPGEQPVTITAYDDAAVGTDGASTNLRLINATLTGDTLTAVINGVKQVDAETGAETIVAKTVILPGAGESTDRVVANQRLELSANEVTFTTPPLASASDVTLLALGTPSADQGETRAFRFLTLPRVTPSNTTVPVAVSPNPFAVIVNGVPASPGVLQVDGASAAAVPFGAVSPRLQVSTNVSVTLDGVTTSLSGILDPAATYLLVLAPNAETSGISMFAYRDVIADGADTRVRAINTTVGTGALDIALDPAPLLGSDLVFGAASPSAGTLVADPASVTRVVATPAVGTPLTYTTTITSAARYVLLLGDTGSNFGVAVVNADWSATFVDGTL